MGCAYYYLEQYEYARKLYENSLRHLEILVGKEHPKYLINLNLLGNAFSALKLYDKAQELYEECYESSLKVFG